MSRAIHSRFWNSLVFLLMFDGFITSVLSELANELPQLLKSNRLGNEILSLLQRAG